MKQSIPVVDISQNERYDEMMRAFYRYIIGEEANPYSYDHDLLVHKVIAEKYVHLVEKVFGETGNLWEKYNVVEGNVNVVTEEKMPAMMGWTAGVYLALQNYLNMCNLCKV